MKKILIAMLVLLAFSVSAIEQPNPNADLGAITQPLAPGVGIQGECTPWEVQNERCEGDIRHYDQCVKTVSGGKWTAKSERCSDYGSNIICSLGKCQRTEEASKTMFYIIATLGIIAFIIIWYKTRR